MASTQRSNIEVFFRVLGAERTRKAFQDVAGAGTSAAGRIGGIGRSMGAALLEVTRRALQLARTISLIGAGGLAALAKGIRDTVESSSELTSVVLALRAINGEIDKASGLPVFAPSANGGLMDVMGAGARNTAADLEYLNKLADKTGVAVKDLAGQYVSLTASTSKSNIALDDARQVFAGVADAALVLGRSNEEAGRAFTALQQIASKGVVTSEELKGQLAEALPGTIPLAAQAFGYGDDIKAFLEQVETGSVTAVEFFRRIGRALSETYGKAALDAANTTRVAMGRLKNAFFNAKVAIGNGPLDVEVRRILNNITKMMNALLANGAFGRLGARIAAALQPLADRFEAAVNGGFDFERVLNVIAATAEKLIAAVGVTITIVGSLVRSLRNMRDVLASYGVKVRPIGEMLIGIAVAFERITQAIATRTFTGNGFLDFFVSLYAVIEAALFAMAKIVAPDVGPGLQTLEQVIARIAYWMNQLAAALITLATGEIHPVLDDTGAGILVNLIKAVDTVRQLKRGIKEFYALVSGRDAPEGADLVTQRRFAQRDKIGDLMSGRPSEEKRNGDGALLVGEGELQTLFRIRDGIVAVVEYLYRNKGVFAALFDGASDTLAMIIALVSQLDFVLRPVADLMGFDGLGSAALYLVGMIFVLTRVAGLFKMIAALIVASIVPALVRMAALMGITYASTAAAALIGARYFAIIALVAYMIFTMVANWRLLSDEMKNISLNVAAGLADKFAEFVRWLGDLLAYIPVVGESLRNRAYANADRYDRNADAAREYAFNNSQANTGQRIIDNKGVDPFANGPRGIGDYLRENGFGDALGIGGPGEQKLSSMDATLKEIAAQNDAAAANDNAEAIGRSVAENIVAAQGGSMRPADITLPDNGSLIRMYGSPEDVATFEQWAAQAARNRAGQRPGWTG